MTKSFGLSVAALIGMVACHTHHVNLPPGPPVEPIVCAGIVTSGPSALAYAPGVLAKAMTGVYDRGEQDIMLRVEAKLPGFGGWFIADGNMVAYMKPSAGISPDVVRQTLYDSYSTRPEEYVRTIMGTTPHAKVIDGRYSLSELIAIENLIAQPRVRIPGFSGVGTSLAHNNVVIGFTDSASVCRGVSAIASMGVPLDAIEAYVWGVIRAL